MRSRLARFDDGVGQHGRLHLGGAPRELDVDVHLPGGEVVPGDAHQLGGNALAVEIGHGLERRIFRRRQHPLHLAEALLGVDQVANARQRRLVGVTDLMFGNPVLAGEAGVEHAVSDVARHFLRADQHALDLHVVDRRKIRSRVDPHLVAGALEQLDRRILQRSLRNSQFQFHFVPASSV
jgi:hypothetical protein